MTVALAVVVALAGGAGAVARYVLDGAVQDRTSGTFPWGTLAVNVTGSFVFGFVTGLAWYHGLGGRASAVLETGLCGGFTTWSTASWESVRLLETGLLKQAGVQAVGGLCVALLAAASGMAIAAL
jgi:CrcB protein